ncbi:hypothetical protein AVEN_187431-1 [Araneus ventricosus]|uniref:Uncharacterized protein n=1 Tax=Araneus ventricosus TaxID=182803 RepID=A0A4Y2G7Z1_ARAVE|nr:hypothetical protein AVEN_187431-1 [Araneus ventricosus]
MKSALAACNSCPKKSIAEYFKHEEFSKENEFEEATRELTLEINNFFLLAPLKPGLFGRKRQEIGLQSSILECVTADEDVIPWSEEADGDTVEVGKKNPTA